ncbi:glycerophosphodiester phosphodiesterase [Neobacillus sp. D3-1R]|uniref:glycerophosphodiester phosphodiesterase n=1 Tax=Neobacillus sp. D3-1R TaxID=3445778 RepID=UPI003F9F1437
MNQANVELNRPLSRKRRLKKWSLLALISILVLYFLLNFGPVEKRPNHPFFTSDRPLVIAHQGGELLAPSNTMMAFQQAVDLGVDVLETDIHITKDGKLVTIHDPSVDRTTNGKGLVSEMSLAEIQNLDAGYHFKDLNGQFSYRGKGAYIPEVEELFQAFPNMKMVIEIKDDNPPERIHEMAEKLWNLIYEYHKEDQVIVASFDQKIVDQFNKISNGKVAIAAGESEIRKFIILKKFFLANLYQPKADAFQIPTEASIFNLSTPSVIKEAKRRNVNVQYWTIDDKVTMRTLLENGANGIMTNRPDLLLEVLKELGY